MPSFLEITDPSKRDYIVEEFVKSKKNITTIETYKQFPRYPSIQAEEADDDGDDDEPKESLMQLGPIATKYLRSMASRTLTDKTFGLHDKDGKFYIGNSEITISGDDIIIDDDIVIGTFGLWELITSKKPDPEIHTTDDLETYTDILLKTNAIMNPATGKVKSSKGEKYNTIIKPIYEEYYQDPPLPPQVNRQ